MGEHFACRGGGDAAAYALGALDDHELDGFRRHLSTCTICQAEIQSFEQLTDILPMSAPQYPAPRALRRRVMGEVRADARRQRAAHAAPIARESRGLRAGGMRSGGWNLGPSRRPGLIGAGAALALVLAVVIVGLTASGSGKHAASTAGTHVYVASTGSAQVLVTAGHGELVVHGLSQLPVTNTYEVWEKRANTPVESSVLFNTSSTGGDAVDVPGSLQGVQEILVTKEPAGGRAQPSGKPLVVARIS